MDTLTTKINIRPSEQTRIHEVPFDNLGFGLFYSDHMLVANYANGKWTDVTIKPYSDISFAPSMTALHYGQSIFEGLKAYRNQEGEPVLFRPKENLKRMNASATRLCMPEIPEEIFLGGMKQLVELDKAWIPTTKGTSLYIRPFFFATDEFTGIRISDHYQFIIFTCPVGAYYPEPVKLMVTSKYCRAFPGGTGEAKAAGNYAASLLGAREAKALGFNNILWLDGIERKYVEECGTMNVFFVIDGKAITPSLDGTVLHGTTRTAAIQLLQDMGVPVEERRISIYEIWEAYDKGKLQEVFGTGTAATIAHVAEIGHDGSLELLESRPKIELPPVSERKVGPALLEKLRNIRLGREEDIHNWVHKI